MMLLLIERVGFSADLSAGSTVAVALQVLAQLLRLYSAEPKPLLSDISKFSEVLYAMAPRSYDDD